MKSFRTRLALGAVAAAGVLAATATVAKANTDASVGSVYTLTNAPGGNAVLVFERAVDGTLALDGTYATGGVGTGGGLGSQGALAFDGGAHELFAVNAGSDSISAFHVEAHGLALDATVPSGGSRPISVTVHGGLLFVLNAGGTGNITGFDVSGRGLRAIAGSTRPLGTGSAGPAQVAFAPDGRTLVVTEKASSTIDTYSVTAHGEVGEPVVHPSVGGTPFGFDFDRRGNLLVSNAAGSASSYALDHAAGLSVISGAVPTYQGAPCWLITSRDGRFAYTANAAGGSITGFQVGPDGSLTRVDADGVTAALGTGSHPLDEAVGNDGRFLYNLTDGQHAVTALRINDDGSLTTVDVAGGLPAGAAGLVAR